MFSTRKSDNVWITTFDLRSVWATLFPPVNCRVVSHQVDPLFLLQQHKWFSVGRGKYWKKNKAIDRWMLMDGSGERATRPIDHWRRWYDPHTVQLINNNSRLLMTYLTNNSTGCTLDGSGHLSREKQLRWESEVTNSFLLFFRWKSSLSGPLGKKKSKKP